MFNLFSVSFFLVSLPILFIILAFGSGLGYFFSSINLLSSLFVFDSITFYFVILVLILGLYSQFVFVAEFGPMVQVFLFMSLFFSLVSFFINHAILFWCFYELAMLPLLFLIFKESPYSERFLAGWYFCCYLVITSLPLVLVLIYLSLTNDSFIFSNWTIDPSEVWLLILLSFIFFTKVPLVPFHTWLPIVHAEATSIVSIFLSGYIMKLGLLGVFRCCNCVFDNNLMSYLLVTLVVSIMFLITSCSELDGKRWLAFLSLAHIVVPFYAFFIGDWYIVNYSFFYCLGHGASAGLVFGLLWCFYELSNSRNWILLKSSVGGSYIMLFCVFSILSLCSFPPTIQFFCEVSLISLSGSSVLYILFWSFYLFFGGLVPLVLCGYILIRSEFFENMSGASFKFFIFFTFLCFWCYLGFFVI